MAMTVRLNALLLNKRIFQHEWDLEKGCPKKEAPKSLQMETKAIADECNPIQKYGR